MSLFYFDIADGTDTIRDDTGTELEDRAEAREQALAVLGPIAKDIDQGASTGCVSVTVRDGAKRPIFHAALTLAEEWLD